MGMTPQQARDLGRLLAEARERKGLSFGQVAERLGVGKAWLHDVENGLYVNIAPDRLARLAEILEIAPSRINRLTDGAVAESLPEVRTYFRAKYGLSPQQAREIADYAARYIDPPEERAS